MKLFSIKLNSLLLRIFLIYLALSLVLLVLPARWTGPTRHAVFMPFTLLQRGLLWVAQSTERAFAPLVGSGKSAAEIRRLEERLVELQARLVQEAERRRLAESRLTQVERLPPEMRARAVLASLTAYDAAPLRRTMVFDKGSRSGVARNCPVLWHGVLIGRVESAGPWTCRAVLVGDRECRVGVRCVRTRARGVLEGIGRGLCRVKYVGHAKDVRPGDLFVTSGLDGIFPAGRLVGTCTAVSNETGEISKWVELKPAFDATRVEVATILLPAGRKVSEAR